MSRIDILVMLGAVVTLFVALGAEPWWTLSGARATSLFNIQVSPFYVHISAIGLPQTVPYGNALGALTRTLLLLGFLALFAASIRPTAWWRNIAVCLGVSTLVELYLSFVLMFYWTQTAFLSAYGVTPPYYGTVPLQGSLLGLDLSYYTSPLVTATFQIPYYVGFVSIGLVTGRTLIKALRERALLALTTLLPGGSIHDVYLTPPYQQVWFSSEDKTFNPMQLDPERLNESELLVSFEKLYETVEPGGSLSIILPNWATTLAERLEKVMPQTGFTMEKAGPIYRTRGKPEKELRFRKPAKAAAPAAEQTTPGEITETHAEPLPPPTTSVVVPEGPVNPESPHVPEPAEEPAWVDTRMTRLERSILKSATKIIGERREPVQYRELLNQVYMDLVDRKIEFDSARQIEATLLIHNGREVQLIEESDDAGLPIIKKWSLGGQKMSPERKHGMPTLEIVKRGRQRLPRLGKIFRKREKPGYRPRTNDDEDSST